MTTDMRWVRRAEVYKAGAPAATLTRGDGQIKFEYLDDYVGPDVAHTLPRDQPPLVIQGGAVPPFFAGLLPEGRRLSAVRRVAKTSADDDLTLLLMVGSDTVGDVTIFPEGADPTPARPAVTAADLADLSFADLLLEARTGDHLAGARFTDLPPDLRFADLPAGLRFTDLRAIPGVQEKLSAGMITLPVRFAGAEAIIKLDPPDYPDAVANESFFLSVARRLRLPVVDTEVVHDRHGRPGLIVRRFDRIVGDEGTRSLAVEDATQLSGLYPADKYTLSSEDAATRIAAACPAQAVAARAALQQFALAWLTGNGDLHGKNISVLQHPSGEWRVAPIYDVPSTLPYGDNSMALPLQGRTEMLTRKRFLAFGAALALRPRVVESAVDEVLAATEPMLEELATGAGPWNGTQRRNLIRSLRRRRRDLLED